MSKIIEKVLDKISKYDIIVNFIPGSVFVYCCKFFGQVDILYNNFLIDIPVIYFYGMLSELIGDALINFLKILKIVNYANYDDFLKADKRNSKVSLISRKVSMLKAMIGSHMIFITFITFKEFNFKRLMFILVGIAVVLEVIRINKEIGFIKKRIVVNNIKNKKTKVAKNKK